MNASDTAYPRLKSSVTHFQLERWYAPTVEELAFCTTAIRGKQYKLGFLLMLKAFQRLGYFVETAQIPNSIIDYIADIESLAADRQQLTAYDVSRTRRHHTGLIRNFLNAHPFVRETKTVLAQAMTAAALTKDELSDIINIGIESLVKHRFELPAVCYCERRKHNARQPIMLCFVQSTTA